MPNGKVFHLSFYQVSIDQHQQGAAETGCFSTRVRSSLNVFNLCFWFHHLPFTMTAVDKHLRRLHFLRQHFCHYLPLDKTYTSFNLVMWERTRQRKNWIEISLASLKLPYCVTIQKGLLWGYSHPAALSNGFMSHREEHLWSSEGLRQHLKLLGVMLIASHRERAEWLLKILYKVGPLLLPQSFLVRYVSDAMLQTSHTKARTHEEASGKLHCHSWFYCLLQMQGHLYIRGDRRCEPRLLYLDNLIYVMPHCLNTCWESNMCKYKWLVERIFHVSVDH